MQVDVGPTTETSVTLHSENSKQVGASFFVQLKLLLRRAVRENLRSKAKIIIQTVQQVTLGLIYGGIYSLELNQVSLGCGRCHCLHDVSKLKFVF